MRKTSGGACQLEAPQQTTLAAFLWSVRRYQADKNIKSRYFFHSTHATEGGAALELATDSPLTLFPEAECYKLPAGVGGLLPSGTVGRILGRSGLTSQGFVVHSGMVDEDSKEETKLMAYVEKGMQTGAGVELPNAAVPLHQGPGCSRRKDRGFGEGWQACVLANRSSMIRDQN